MRVVVAVILACLWAGLLRAADARPNIVFVITDDQRFDYLGCAGHPVLKTPNIDRLAREGAIFKNFFVSTPLCSPSRASFLTGLYPHAHRIINNDRIGLDAISHTLVTFPRMLRESGYETAFVGKWHMGSDDSRRPGFDHWASFKGQGVYIDGVVNNDGRALQLTGYMTDYLNDQAVEFIEKPHGDKPFALYLAHKAVHRPYLPAKRHEELYSDYTFKPPEFPKSDRAGKLALTRPLDERVDVLRMEGAVPEPAEPRRGRGNSPAEVVRDQLRCIAAVDEGVGRITAALEKSGQLDNTIIVYTSDNGYLMGEHGLFDNKRWPYEESIRVPMVMRFPKLIRAGTVIEPMVMNVDVAPTMMEIAGAKPYVKMHGRSLVPLFKDPKASWRTSTLTEYFTEKVGPRVPDWQAVRTERWKYVHYPALEGMDELYDLQKDGNEWSNIAGATTSKPIVDEMRGELTRLLAETKMERGE